MTAASFKGRIIDDRYVLEALLGQGGMGAVFRARHRNTSGEVALKLLHPEVAAIAGVASRFAGEARASAVIGHPGIVKVTDAGTTKDGELYLVMELLQGETLRDRLTSRGRFAPVEALRIALGALDALGAAHAAGIVHRDLKPENVFLVAETDAPKLLDFGIAKVMAQPTGPQTATGSMMGTVSYMSPEQLRDTARVDHRTDLWSLAVILYEMLTGRRPFDAASAPETMVNILSREAPPPSRAMSPCPPEVDAFFARALARDVMHRFESAAAMIDAVRALAAATLSPESNASLARASARPSAPRPASFSPPAMQPVVAAPAVVVAPPFVPTTPAAVQPPKERPFPILAVVLGGGGALLVFAVLGILLISVAASNNSPQPSRQAQVMTGARDDALCRRACKDFQTCAGIGEGSCLASCMAQPDFRRCLGSAHDCRAVAGCYLGGACGGGTPHGTTSCKVAADCEGACLQRGGNIDACICGCERQVAPDRALELAANNACAVTRCGQWCSSPITYAALCQACFNSHCGQESARCLAR